MTNSSGVFQLRDVFRQQIEEFMNIIIGNSTLMRNSPSNQIILTQQKKPKFNLASSSSDYKIFCTDRKEISMWIRNILHQLDQEGTTSQISLLNFLSNDNNNPQLQEEEKSKASNIGQEFHQYRLYNQIPKLNFFFANLDLSMDGQVMFIVRNYQGQIIFLSFHPSTQKRYQILRNFLFKIQNFVLLIIFDNLYDQQYTQTRISQRQFEELQKNIQLVYLQLFQLDYFSILSRKVDTYSRYQIKWNSIQKYLKSELNSFSNERVMQLLKILSFFNFQLAKEEFSQFAQISQKLLMFKVVLKINFDRKLQNQFSLQKDFQKEKHFKFSDFIKWIINFFKQMSQLSLSPQQFHQPSKISRIADCLYCLKTKFQSVPAQFCCQICSQILKQGIYLCFQCFKIDHRNLQLFFSEQSDNEIMQSNSSSSPNLIEELQNQKVNSQGMCAEDDISQNFALNQDSQSPIELKRQAINVSKLNNLKQDQVQKLSLLHESSQRIINMFRQLQKSNEFYHPMYSIPLNYTEFQEQIRSQHEFMKNLQNYVNNEIETFQSQILLAIYGNQEEKKNLLCLDQSSQNYQNDLVPNHAELQIKNQRMESE